MTFHLVGSLAIKITLLLALALLIDGFLRRRSVLATATLWNAVLVALVVLPLASVLVPGLSLPLLPADSRPVSGEAEAAADGPHPSQPAVAGHRVPFASGASATESTMGVTRVAIGQVLDWIFAGIYGLGVATMLARLLAGWHCAASLRRKAVPVTNSQWLRRLDSWLAILGSANHQLAARTRHVTLLQSDEIDVPVALGVLRPAIVIPSPLSEAATLKTVDAILIHELAHIDRADCAWQLLDRLVHAALWLHPLMWIAQTRMAFIRERACDDFAVHMVGDFRSYGETLLDIAAGARHRRALGLGLTIVRSSNLAQRLSAIAQSDGSSRCVAAPTTQWTLTTALIFVAMGLGSLGLDRAAAKGQAASVAPPTNAPPAAVTPELIAVTWQQVPESNDKRIEQPVWRPDGKRLTDIEANALLDQVKSFQTHWWNKEETLRPLVLVYRRPPGMHAGLMTSLVLPNGRRMGTASWMYSLPNGLTKSSCSPQRADLKSWPAKIDLDVKVPLEDPQVIKTFRSIPAGVVEVAPGVRWFTGKEAPSDEKRWHFAVPFGSSDFLAPPGELTKGLLEVRNEGLESAVLYDTKIWLRGKGQPIPEEYQMVDGKHTVLHGTTLGDLKSIERVEFTRQRFRFERIKGVETHLDLLPPDP
jgi:beta-lactamase regulating signal transducer with metallopeptidase domain